MLRIIRCLSACGVFVFLSFHAIAAEPGATTPAGKKLDLTFVPNDAVAAAVVHPQRILKSPEFELWPTEIATAGGKKEFGFDPMQIELAVTVAAMPQMAGGQQPQPGAAPAGPPQPRFGIVLRFMQAQDAKVVLPLIVKDGRDGVVSGKAARLASQPMQLSATFVDERTLVLAPEASLAWTVAGGSGDSPLRTLMAAADDSPDAALFVNLDPIRPLLMPVVAMGAGQLPPQFAELTRVPTLTNTIEFRIVHAGQSSGAIELDLGTDNQKDAVDLQHVLKQGLDNGKAMFLNQLAKQPTNPDDREMTEATQHYMNRLSDKIVAVLQPKQQGSHVLIHADVQGGAAEVGILVALLLPAVQAAREAAHRNMSQNNLKQIALCMLNYEDQHHMLPPRAFFDKEGKPLLSWRVMMLPDLEESDLFQQFHFDEPWDSDHNKTLIEKMPAAFKDPRFELPPGMTIYQAVVGKGCVFDGDKGIKLAQITDGTSKTAGVVAVSPSKAVPWTKPEDWEFDPKNPLRDLENPSPGGIIQLMFMDGHIEGVSPDVDPKILKAIFTRNGGEAWNLP